jgi:hypothetical protein
MDIKQSLGLIVSVVAGAAGYLMVTFWFQPILRYRDIKYRVAADLVFFGNAIELQKENGKLRNDTLERKDSNRRYAADLKAIYPTLPFWYQCWLQMKKENPVECWKNLTHLSNSSELDEAKDLMKIIKLNLRLPE